MKIVIDRAIPLLDGVLEPYADVVYCEGAKINAEVVRDAAAIVTRTRTKCNRELLEGSCVEAICSATIGYDHIDMEYCAEQSIATRTAVGCNSRAVLQWFAAAVSYLSQEKGWEPCDKTVGVVGVGSVGSLIVEYCRSWGFNVICCDPPRGEREEGFESTPLEELLSKSDIITIHTPLDSSTRHMLNAQTLELTRPDAVILNSSRGATIDGDALLNSSRDYILDVWEHEPDISRELLQSALLATPHIAGYSVQGKAAATTMSVNNLAKIFDLPLKGWQAAAPRSTPRPISWDEMRGSVAQYFDIKALSDKLKISPESFESMRNGYDYRNEYF